MVIIIILPWLLSLLVVKNEMRKMVYAASDFGLCSHCAFCILSSLGAFYKLSTSPCFLDQVLYVFVLPSAITLYLL